MKNGDKNLITDFCIDLLKQIIRIPSFSREENEVAGLIEEELKKTGLNVERKNNNLWCKAIKNASFPTILLNSHLDTVRPSDKWTYDPFDPVQENNRIYGLGSNDAGGSVVALLAAYLLLFRRNDLPYNLVLAISGEEEISGNKGIESVLDEFGKIDLGIIGEPTSMKLAVSEKGLMVLDCVSSGQSYHAAKDGGVNAIYKAMTDIEWIRNYNFARTSKLLGRVKMQVTQINAGQNHNVVPDKCTFVIDVRTNECYTNQEVYETISENLASEVIPRSFRLNASFIQADHPVVIRAMELGLECTGSDTLSDQALMSFPTVKIGPGSPLRSHTTDEYIEIDEILQGVEIYLALLQKLNLK